MTKQSEAVEIARGLTKEKRAFVCSLPGDGSPKWWPAGMMSHECKGLRGFGQSGLLESKYGHDGVFHALTPIGLEVRNILTKEQSNG